MNEEDKERRRESERAQKTPKKEQYCYLFHMEQ
jgi:hypothetical protein